MSCNGCRVLRKGCSDQCMLRHCLSGVDGPEAQGHATLFLAKFYGRAGLMGFISAVEESQRPALFQSLLFEACGRTISPVYGAAGLLWMGQWSLCEAAVEAVLRGSSLKDFQEAAAAASGSGAPSASAAALAAGAGPKTAAGAATSPGGTGAMAGQLTQVVQGGQNQGGGSQLSQQAAHRMLPQGSHAGMGSSSLSPDLDIKPGTRAFGNAPGAAGGNVAAAAGAGGAVSPLPSHPGSGAASGSSNLGSGPTGAAEQQQQAQAHLQVQAQAQAHAQAQALAQEQARGTPRGALGMATGASGLQGDHGMSGWPGYPAMGMPGRGGEVDAMGAMFPHQSMRQDSYNPAAAAAMAAAAASMASSYWPGGPHPMGPQGAASRGFPNPAAMCGMGMGMGAVGMGMPGLYPGMANPAAVAAAAAAASASAGSTKGGTQNAQQNGSASAFRSVPVGGGMGLGMGMSQATPGGQHPSAMSYFPPWAAGHGMTGMWGGMGGPPGMGAAGVVTGRTSPDALMCAGYPTDMGSMAGVAAKHAVSTPAHMHQGMIMAKQQLAMGMTAAAAAAAGEQERGPNMGAAGCLSPVVSKSNSSGTTVNSGGNGGNASPGAVEGSGAQTSPSLVAPVARRLRPLKSQSSAADGGNSPDPQANGSVNGMITEQQALSAMAAAQAQAQAASHMGMGMGIAMGMGAAGMGMHQQGMGLGNSVQRASLSGASGMSGLSGGSGSISGSKRPFSMRDGVPGQERLPGEGMQEGLAYQGQAEGASGGEWELFDPTTRPFLPLRS